MSVISMKQLLEAGISFLTSDKKMEPKWLLQHLHREKWYLYH